ncbi:YoaK family protein [uncultured Allofournierella sp.]|uniref:YoaK family protein n=1 Tax=uncultured Allofournierella sp. TaxID=1940258 RepID=UPI003752CC04
MKEQQLQRVESSEALRVAMLLGLSGGFLEVYTYLNRGAVFANAQTGNLALLAMHTVQREWAQALDYLVPIVSFTLGIVITRMVRARGKQKPGRYLHWRQWILLAELTVLWGVGFIPQSEGWNRVANICVAFVCSLQYGAFRRIHGQAFATIMCTGNLRSGTEELWQFFATRQKQHLYHALNFYGGILAFMVGAAIGGLACPVLKEQAIWMACLPLVVVFSCLFFASFPTLQVDS